jgi:hypothetical protein
MASFGNEDVRWFDVAMDDAFRVSGVQPLSRSRLATCSPTSGRHYESVADSRPSSFLMQILFSYNNRVRNAPQQF